MDTAEISAIVAVIGTGLSLLGITGVDSAVLGSAVNGVISIVTIGAAVLSWWGHRKKNAQQ